MTLTPKQLEFMSREIYKAEQIVARGIGRPVKLIISFDIAEDLAFDHVHEFIEAICKAIGTTVTELRSKSRGHFLVERRRCVIHFLSMYYPLLTLKEIGSYLNLDHTSVIHAQRRAKELIEINDAYFWPLIKKAQNAVEKTREVEA